MPRMPKLQRRGPVMTSKTLAFEIGTEEIPAFDLQNATKQFPKLLIERLDDIGLSHGDIDCYTTPRRMIAIVADVAASTEALVEEHKGPSVKIAFDEEGNPTKAAEGFARGKGIDVGSLERREVDGVEYVFAVTSKPAMSATELLPSVLEGVIESISWPKSMCWGTEKALFSRPVRWLVAYLGDEILPVRFAGLEAGNVTYGHRFLSPGAHEVNRADDLIGVVRSAHVVPSEDERKAVIASGVAKVEADTGYTAVLPPKTLTEVINLSEYPTVMVGTFDEMFLKVPEEIIVDAMLMHQRYFPLYDNGKLTNKFIIVSNGDPECETTIVDGNERVVAARLYDAKFFYEEDLRHPLEAYVEHLDEVVFQEQLGTMRSKTDRVARLAEKLCVDADVEAFITQDVARAALLSKADLVTNAVIEFTSVQGIMGSYYAIESGESERVAQAIAEHYRPRFAGDEPPKDIVGKFVAAADKLDTVCGLFAVDQAPTGSSDPFALRRAALGIISILQSGLDISLERAIDDALSIYQESDLEFDREKTRAEVLEFFITRCRVMLHDQGMPLDAIDAVLAAGVLEPVTIIERVAALQHARSESADTFDDLATAYGRANNLRDADAGIDFDPTLFSESETKLADAIAKASTEVEEYLADGLYEPALDSLASLRTPIDEFFETTMVMDDDDRIRANRMKLLNRFIGVFANVADFGLMVKTR